MDPAQKSTGDKQAVKKNMEILSDMEVLKKDEFDRPITPASAITAIEQTAKTIESMYQSTTTAKTHLQLKGGVALIFACCDHSAGR